MRENIGWYHGKRKDNDEWIEGYLFCIWNEAYILWGTTNGIPNMIEVIPETVGQYTELTDKNGTKIFEGDIVKFKILITDYVGKIVFNKKICAYEITYETTVGAYGEKATHKLFIAGIEDRTVIGNIHDNPELLKGGDE